LTAVCGVDFFIFGGPRQEAEFNELAIAQNSCYLIL